MPRSHEKSVQHYISDITQGLVSRGQLALYARNGEIRIRLAVAQSFLATGSMLAELGKDPEVIIRLATAKNINTPIPILRLLGMDEHPAVARAAKSAMRAGGCSYKDGVAVC